VARRNAGKTKRKKESPQILEKGEHAKDPHDAQESKSGKDTVAFTKDGDIVQLHNLRDDGNLQVVEAYVREK